VKLQLIAVGGRMPGWVDQGYQEYARRMPRECQLMLREIPARPRGKHAAIEPLLKREAEQILAAIPRGHGVIALDVNGKAWNTEQLSRQLADWMASGRDYSLLIGGAEGLHSDCLARADLRWSLSPLTFPHPLVRVIVAEQLYRAWTLLRHHPYHRA